MAPVSTELISGILKLGQRTFSTVATRNKYDIVVVGGGIVGPAVAREVTIRYPKLKVAILEKESKIAQHQTGHNSGVIHAGIYYKPGSLKAKLCVEGLHLIYKYCDEKNIPYKKIGKLVVATDQEELERLDDLYNRGLQNKVPGLRLLNSQEEIKQIEPYCRGLKAIHSPHTGIVDYSLIAENFVDDVKTSGGDIHMNFEVTEFKTSFDPDFPILLQSKQNETVLSKYVLTCTGLHSDFVARMTGCEKNPRIVPFRGEYLVLDQRLAHMVKGNIYPVPDPKLPFLGVHFTPRMDGSVWLGPNAVLAFRREGYSWFDINLSELADTLTFPGFYKLAYRHARYGIGEVMRSVNTALQVKALQRFIPEVTVQDVRRGPAGVRAQAMDAAGNLVDDFVFDKGVGVFGERVLHCRNAPSPGATSSMAIAKMIADRLREEFGLG